MAPKVPARSDPARSCCEEYFEKSIATRIFENPTSFATDSFFLIVRTEHGDDLIISSATPPEDRFTEDPVAMRFQNDKVAFFVPCTIQNSRTNGLIVELGM